LCASLLAAGLPLKYIPGRADVLLLSEQINRLKCAVTLPELPFELSCVMTCIVKYTTASLCIWLSLFFLRKTAVYARRLSMHSVFIRFGAFDNALPFGGRAPPYPNTYKNCKKVY